MTPERRRALVVFESVFGNTRQIAEAIAGGLKEHFDVQLAEAAAKPSPAGAALIVVGGPIHALGMSKPATREEAAKQAREFGHLEVSTRPGIREWLSELPPTAQHVDAAVFDTAVKVGWFVIGSAARGEASILEKKGYSIAGRPEHFLVKDVDGPLVPGELERAKAWGEGLGDLLE